MIIFFGIILKIESVFNVMTKSLTLIFFEVVIFVENKGLKFPAQQLFYFFCLYLVLVLAPSWGLSPLELLLCLFDWLLVEVYIIVLHIVICKSIACFIILTLSLFLDFHRHLSINSLCVIGPLVSLWNRYTLATYLLYIT